jgi:hypothetical protein
MVRRLSMGTLLLIAALLPALPAGAWDDSRYPDFKGQWTRADSAQFDPTKGAGLAQQVPYNEEYLARFKAIAANRGSGGLDANWTAGCLPAGMPRAMIVYETMEIIVTPETTYIYLSYMNEFRRIFTDSRAWPDYIEPSFAGYSIGKWEAGEDGKYAVLNVETRGLKGPRSFSGDGLPLHDDNATIVKERIFLDKASPDRLHDEIVTIDHALTRPWTVFRTYKREHNPFWSEFVCAENNNQLVINGENYYLNNDGYLLPTRKDQPPPDLKFFKQPPN